MVIYTSYDGDLIPNIDLFIAFVLTEGGIPLNPTKLLGYYTSTIAHKNSKRLALEDCISIELIADELWLFLDGYSSLCNLAEGVILELLYWEKYKGGKIRIFTLNEVLEFMNKKKSNIDINEKDYDINKILKNIDKSKLAELQLLMTKKEDLRPPVYINIVEEHHKYIDWVKLLVFRNSYVPIDVKSEITNFVAKEYSKLNLNQIEEIIKSKVDKSISIDEYTSRNNKWSLELAGVPKYIEKKWALTNSERTKKGEIM